MSSLNTKRGSAGSVDKGVGGLSSAVCIILYKVYILLVGRSYKAVRSAGSGRNVSLVSIPAGI